jgi:cell division protease FtsH
MKTSPGNKKTSNNKKPSFSILPILLPVIVLILFASIYDSKNSRSPLTLKSHEFLAYVQSDQIKSAKIDETRISGDLAEGKSYIVIIYPDQRNILVEILQNHNIPFEVVAPSSNIWGHVISIGSTILIILFFWFLLSRTMQSSGGGQVFNFGKSTAKLFMSEGPKITFKDVAGLHEAKEEMLEIVDFLKEPKKFTKMGAKVPKGVLLVGPPGCGKTLMAKAISGEAKVPFFSVSGSEFVEMFVGVGASRVRDLFSQAKKFAPALIFVDEIDAVGRQRGAGLGGGHDEREQTLNQLLVEMDGFDPHVGIIIIAATNRPDVLDPALLRPGRFDRQIVVDMPNSTEREEILRIHAKNKPMTPEVNLTIIARRTAGFTGADLENLLNEAAILATRRSKQSIDMNDIESSIDRIIAGPEKKSRVVNDKEKRIIAIHETGHAAIIRSFTDQEPVHKISIISRGMALGYTLQVPYEDKYLRSSQDLIHTISALLGGRAAEEILLGDVSTGAENDLLRSTRIAADMVCKYGMSLELGPRTFGKEHGPVFLGRDFAKERDYSEETGKLIDAEVSKIICKAYEEAKKIIKDKQDVIEEISQMLIEKEILEGEDLESYLNKIRAVTEEEKSKWNFH